jgi:diguanylate cyclase (GGDEF)-like protein
MQDADALHALCILVVSEDRGLTRELSRFLNMAGYRTLAAAEPNVARRALETGRPHVALVDARMASRDQWALSRLLRESSTTDGLLKFLLVHELDDAELQEALDAGFDDIFSVPLCYGELLARLHSAARVLEFDRRAGQLEPLDAATGLPGRSSFTAQVRRRWSAAAGQVPRIACVLVDLDYFAALGRSEGHLAAGALLASVAEELQKLQGDADVLACLGGNRFAAILDDADAEVGHEWAQRIGQALAAKSFSAGKTTCRITASCGVAGSDTANSSEQLIRQATEALANAKSSGRNCVARWDQLDEESAEARTWGCLLDRTVSADVLTPCAVFLQASEPLTQAAELFRQTRLEAIPVVDVDGKLLGLCKREHPGVAPADAHAGSLVRDVMTSDVKRFGRREEFSSLMEFFNDDPLAWAVIVDDGRPVGLLNCDNILGLSQPVPPFRRASDSQFTDSTEYLLVPDVAVEKWNESV